VIVTPHLGGGSRNSMTGVVERTSANIRRFLAGEPIVDLVPLAMPPAVVSPRG
jgi:phosphoglycerate dehydrogenase-like enzyme